jgi:hypothetical protein
MPDAEPMDADAYDAELRAMGYVFEDDPTEEEEPETELTFIVESESEATQNS